MRLWAISDLHVGHPGNGAAVDALPSLGDDWLIVAGDVAEQAPLVVQTLARLRERVGRLIWVPGNHELWRAADDAGAGVARYLELVRRLRAVDVHTPEDGWLRWPGEGPATAVVPLFLLYDYSFAPDGLRHAEGAVAWAREAGIRPADEVLLEPHPYADRAAWCRARLAAAEALLATVPADHATVLVNHWPLRQDLVRIPRVPRYTPWCGTAATTDWHRRWRARVVVAGHLHVRTTDWRDGTRFEEVSLGYPRDWHAARGVRGYLREILPGPPGPAPKGDAGPVVHR